MDYPFSIDFNIEQQLQARTKIVDDILHDHWKQHSSLTLIALGGYGRCELYPASDQDILILSTDPLKQSEEEFISNFINSLLDKNLLPSQSVRSLSQCEQFAKEDISTITSFIDARLLSGDAKIFENLKKIILTHSVWSRQEYFKEQVDKLNERHKKYLSAEFNYCPHIKNHPGSLRDWQTLNWIAKYCFEIHSADQWVKQKFITPQDYQQLIKHQQWLKQLRFFWHEKNKKPNEQLTAELLPDSRYLINFYQITHESHLLMQNILVYFGSLL